MKWLELSVSAPPEFVEPLSGVFYRYGHGGVATEQAAGYNPDEGEIPPLPDRVKVITYLPVQPGMKERRSRIDLAVRLIAQMAPITPLRERVIDEADWENIWKQHFHVLHAGRRIVVVPTWRRYEPAPAEAVILLDPGMAFGTGHHPTTRMCLEQLEATMAPSADVLDVGCGSGILCIAAIKLGARSVIGLDSDPLAVRVARANLKENGIRPPSKITQGSLPHPDIPAESFDIAVANISSKVISDIADELVATVRRGGTLIASGMLDRDREVMTDRLTQAGAQVKSSLVDSDWITLVAAVA